MHFKSLFSFIISYILELVSSSDHAFEAINKTNYLFKYYKPLLFF